MLTRPRHERSRSRVSGLFLLRSLFFVFLSFFFRNFPLVPSYPPARARKKNPRHTRSHSRERRFTAVNRKAGLPYDAAFSPFNCVAHCHASRTPLVATLLREPGRLLNSSRRFRTEIGATINTATKHSDYEGGGERSVPVTGLRFIYHYLA